MERQKIEKMVNEDLKKPYHQLLVDIQEELLNEERSIEDNVRHAQKRITSLFAKMGLDSQRAQDRMLKLTNFIVFLVFVQIVAMFL